MTKEEIAELRGLLAKATPKEWEAFAVLEAENAVFREALKPFSDEKERVDEEWINDDMPLGMIDSDSGGPDIRLTFGDLRRAAAAVAKGKLA